MSFFETQFKNLKYVINYPEKYNQTEKYPVILFLHGAGTRGDNIEVLKNNLYFKLTKQHSDELPFITVAPLCKAFTTWFDHFETLKELVLEITKMPFCDIKRIYIIGASMGGYATWQLAMSMPQLFAAIMPICGGGMYWNAAQLKNVPVWAFHGEKDHVVFCTESKNMVDAVNTRGGNARLTLYPENEHDAWTDTYNNKEAFKWLLSHENENTKEIENIFTNSKIYG